MKHKYREKIVSELHESEKRYRALVENVNSIILRMDPEGRIIFFNEYAQRFFGYTTDDVLGKNVVGTIVPETDASGADLRAMILDIGQNPLRYADNENENMRKDGSRIWISWTNKAMFDRDGNISEILCVGNDITERKATQDEQKLILELLTRLNQTTGLQDLLKQIVLLMREWSGCEAVGIRLREEDDFPYFETRGFSADFVENERHLCKTDQQGELIRDSKGNPVLECMCGNVIYSRFDPALPFFTAKGSFWTNSTTDLLSSTSETDRQTRTRNRCNGEGYESVALIPLRYGSQNIGLLQFNDFRRNRFNDAKIARMERLASNLTIGIIQRQTADALVRSEEKYRLIAENMSDVISIMDMDFRFTYISPSIRVLSGYTVEEAIRLSIDEILTPESLKKVLTIFEEEIMLESSGTADPSRTRVIEFEQNKKNASIVWVEASCSFIRDTNRKPTGILVISRDITHRKLAEDKLRRRESQLEQIFDILPIGLWFADKDGRLLRGNPAGVKIWEAEPKVPISEYGIFKAWRLPSREPVAAQDWALARTIREGVTIVDELLEIEAFDGRRKTILNYTAPVLDANGKMDGAIVVNLDVSDRLALQAQLAQAQKLESVGRLAGGVAHDFNNMLGVILTNAELAIDEIDPSAPVLNYIRDIRTAAQRSSEITRQLLAFARQQTITPRILDLNSAIGGILRMLKRLIGENIRLDWLPGDNLWRIKMDPSQIDQILANLLVNARDAINDTGIISVETHNVSVDDNEPEKQSDVTPGEFVLLTVTDNGAGMDNETLIHLFEPFFTTKEPGRGTGLGLATVYGIVTQNNGFIKVNSKEGSGTTFRIYIPRNRAEISAPVEKRKLKTAGGGHETILLVEDEPLFLKVVKTRLQKYGYTVIDAAGPMDAIRMADEYTGKIDLLITDMIMPEMNGRDLADGLTSIYPDIKTLFMSGYSAGFIEHHGILEKDLNFIQKPFSVNKLGITIREIMKKEKR